MRRARPHKKTYKLQLRALITVIFLLIIYFTYVDDTLQNAPWEVYNSWRQTDTYAVAQIYQDHGVNLLNPQFYYDGPGLNTIQLELQILPALSVLIANVLSLDLVYSLRLVSLFFFLGSALLFYGLALFFMKNTPAFVATLLYMFAPLNMLLSRAIMPESVVLFFYIGALYYLAKWHFFRKSKDSYISAVFLAFAIIEKIPAAFLGLLVIYLYISNQGKKAFKNKDFYAYGIIALLPSIIYFGYMHTIANHSFVSGIASKHIFSNTFSEIFSPETTAFYQRLFTEHVGYVILVFGLIGMIKMIQNKDRFLMGWFFVFFIETFFIVSIIKFEYYFIFMLPILAFLGGYAIESDHAWPFIMWPILLVVLVLFVREANNTKDIWLKEVREITIISDSVKDYTDEDDYIAVNSVDPSVINASNRNGARIGMEYYEQVPTDPEEEADYWLDLGVDYFCLLKEQPKYKEFYDKAISQGNDVYDDDLITIIEID